MALQEKIDPSSIHTYKFQDLTTKFLDSGKEGTFILQKKTNEGRTVQVSIGVPEWLASQLKHDCRRDKQFKQASTNHAHAPPWQAESDRRFQMVIAFS